MTTLNLSEKSINMSATRELASKSLVQLYYSLLLSAGLYLSLLAFTTTCANGLLLWTIYKNSKPYFRKPVTVLIAALALADFLNGLIIDPLYASIYFSLYFKSISRSAYHRLAEVGMVFSVITMNASYLIVLTLSCTQLIAISFPYKQRTLITIRSVSFAVVLVLAYSILFALSYIMGIPVNLFQKLEVFLNMTGITVVLIAAYVCLQISYTRQRGKFRRLMTASKIQGQEESRVHRDPNSVAGSRKVLMVNLLLIGCLLITSLPVTVIWYLRLFSIKLRTESQMLAYRNVALVVDNFLFLKFLVDPFIYAWRMPKYRKALRQTINFLFNCQARSARRQGSNTQNSLGTMIHMLSHRRMSSRQTRSLREVVEEDAV
ncbi:rhodopsin, GQ-coupled-like [Actinia tenebrosa]|uniref:Rhodopsin, GQ-coupled-like n=1 Tax=Actinia tenebrosa TaxID=6105 RepID=A0A6P8IVW5_ACTTE|nr:rhodopsin, GQ-coupled-like [Actinia tenebrosa]